MIARHLLATGRGTGSSTGGSGGLVGSSQPFTITSVPEGGWSEVGAPRAAYASGHTFIGYICGNTRPNNVEIVDWNHSTQTRTGPFILRASLGGGSSTTPDSHNAPAVLVRPDGIIVTAYSGHAADQLRFRRSTVAVPFDITNSANWELEKNTLVVPNSTCTYPNLVYLSANTTHYVFWRDSGVSDFFMATSTNGWDTTPGRTWLVNVPGHMYFAITDNGVDRIDFVITDTAPEKNNGVAAPSTGNGLWHMYMLSDGTFHKTDGTTISSAPFDITELQQVVAPPSKVFPYSLSSLANGQPIVGCASQTVNPAQVWTMEWTGSAWQRYDVATVAAAGANICVDAANPNRALVDYPSGSTNILEEYVRSASGSPWTLNRTITNAGNQPNGMVNVKNSASDLRMIWQYGTFNGSDDFDAGVMGLGA